MLMQNRLFIIKSTVDKEKTLHIKIATFDNVLVKPYGFKRLIAYGWNKDVFFDGTKTIKDANMRSGNLFSSSPVNR